MSERRPKRVYGTGSEPDPRLSLANERTFLAWIRTAVALLAAAVAVDVLDLSLPDLVVRGTALALASIALLCAVQAWFGWAATEAAMRQGRPLPGAAAKLPVVAVLTLVAVVAAVALIAG